MFQTLKQVYITQPINNSGLCVISQNRIHVITGLLPFPEGK